MRTDTLTWTRAPFPTRPTAIHPHVYNLTCPMFSPAPPPPPIPRSPFPPPSIHTNTQTKCDHDTFDLDTGRPSMDTQGAEETSHHFLAESSEPSRVYLGRRQGSAGQRLTTGSRRESTGTEGEEGPGSAMWRIKEFLRLEVSVWDRLSRWMGASVSVGKVGKGDRWCGKGSLLVLL